MLREIKKKVLAGLTLCACIFATAGAGVATATAKAETSDGNDAPTSAQTVTESETVTEAETESLDEEANGNSIEIVAKNLSYSESIYILYAVDFAGFDESQNEVRMLFWSEPQTEYTVETATAVKSAEYFTSIGDRECIVFYSDGIPAKAMNDMLYCRAYAYVDDEAVYSAVEKYSVVDYVYEKRAAGGLTDYQKNTFTKMLDYGASTQQLFGYKTNALANSTYYTVKAQGGKVDDGFEWGRYVPNATATLTATPGEGETFMYWLNAKGEVATTAESFTLAVNAHTTYTAKYLDSVALNAYEWEENADGVTITAYKGAEENLAMPFTLDGKPVTAIGANAFSGNKTLKQVILPESLVSIGDGAFSGCTSLTSIALPVGVTSLGDNAFADCKALTKIEFSEILSSIGAGAFSGCSGLTQVMIPETVSVMGKDAFKGCKATIYCGMSLMPDGWSADWNPDGCDVLWGMMAETPAEMFQYSRNSSWNGSSYDYYITIMGYIGEDTVVVIPSAINGDPVWYINQTFRNRNDITSVVIPDSVKSISSNAFYNCTGLKTVVIPNSVTGIDYNAFYGCTSLTSVVIPDSVTYISDYAFQGCTSLTSVVIPDSVTSIGNSAFHSCSSLTSIVIPDSVTSISYYAFENCTSLRNVTIGDGLASVSYGAFSNCPNYTDLYIDSLEAWCTKNIDGRDYLTEGGKNIYFAGELLSSELVIPEGITEISNGAFSNCKELQIVHFPESLEIIREYAFAFTKLKNVLIPDSVTEIKAGAFCGCYQLENIKFGSSVEVIGESAFVGCALVELQLGENVRIIGDNAFSSCETLKRVYIPNTLEEIAWGAFVYLSIDEVYIDSIEAWCNIVFTNDYANPLSGGASLHWMNGEQIEDLVIPVGVNSIGDYAFDSCQSLTSVVIPDSVSSIGAGAFRACSNLQSVVIGKGVKAIGKNAFSYCYGLKNISVAEENKETKLFDGILYANSGKSVVFYLDSSNIGDVVVLDGATEIYEAAFAQSNTLRSVVLPDSLEIIMENAFNQCYNLESVSLGSGVRTMQNFAFNGCGKLVSIFIPISATEVEQHVFGNCGSLTIYCETDGRGSGWSSSWNSSDCPVVWGAPKISYSFSVNGGEKIENIVSAEAIRLPIPNRENYYFAGWYDNPEFIGLPMGAKEFYYSSEKTILYARWLSVEECNGESFDTAYIAFGDSFVVEIDEVNECVYYKFTAKKTMGYQIRFYSTVNGVNSRGKLYDESKNCLSDENYWASEGYCFMHYTLNEGETYYIVTYLNSGETGIFTMEIILW